MSRKQRRSRGFKSKSLDIPGKATRILSLILIALSMIVARVWYLSVIQYENKMEEARKPQRRAVVKPANRGTIRDRFNLPLAVNKVQYQAAILYSQLRQIPAIAWEKSDDGKKVRRYKRREYIEKLSALLAKELDLDAARIEDMIYSKAALYYNIPYVLKEEISEGCYYRLRMLEKDWLGVQARCVPKRHYPLGRVAADLIGYMGPINKREYEAVISEMNLLEELLLKQEEGEDIDLPEGIATSDDAYIRLAELRRKAYSINDYVGKSGIEGIYEQQLRGSQGKSYYYSDARGNFLRELPGAEQPLSGQRFLLTLSSELQAYAEELLIKHEETRKAHVSSLSKEIRAQEPWIKGGAIVAMDPNNGDILALASYPRYDPNDFIPSGDEGIDKEKRANILRWFESDSYIGEVWDQKRPLMRERYDKQDGIVDETPILSWERYLELALTEQSPLYKAIKNVGTVKAALELQQAAETLVSLTAEKNLSLVLNYLQSGDGKNQGERLGIAIHNKMKGAMVKSGGAIQRAKALVDKYTGALPHCADKILLIDLCRLAVPSDRFSEQLVAVAGKQQISDYRDASAAMATINAAVRDLVRDLHHQHAFVPWRRDNQNVFLKEKRAEEKQRKQYARPYLDYLDEQESKLFNAFWKRHRWQLLTSFLIGEWIEPHPDEKLQPYLDGLITWQKELLQGAHHKMDWWPSYHTLTDALKGMSLDHAVEYLQTLRSYHELDRPLYGRYRQLQSDEGFQREKHLAAAFYPKYGFGYARPLSYRGGAALGSIFKLVTAYEALVQRYQTLANPETATIEQLNPITIEDRFFKKESEEFLGCHKNGQPIPRFYRGGRLPRSLSSNLGALNILSAIEKSSNPYFALLAGDQLESPEDLAAAARLFSFGSPTGAALSAEIGGKVPEDLRENRNGLYALAIGQHSLVTTPLQAAVMLSTIANGGRVLEPRIINLSAGAAPEKKALPHALTPYRYQDFSVAVKKGASKPPLLQVSRFPTVEKRTLFFPQQVRELLLEGMQRVVERSYQYAFGSLQQHYRDYPEAIRDFLALEGEIAGKTSTAESVEMLGLDRERGTNTYNHLWFGGIIFDKSEENYLFHDKFGKPELVVVVFLRYGAYGKDIAPIAAQVAAKWREIRKRR